MKDLDTLLPDVLPEAPGCPTAVAINALEHAAQRFCRDTHAWVEEVDRFRVTPHRTYEVFVDSDRELIAIASVHAGDRTLTYGFDFAESVLTLNEGRQGETVIVYGALQPANRKLPDWLASQYGEGIAHGATERLVAMRGVEWSDPNAMSRHRTLFQQAVAEARMRKARGYSEQPLRVRPRSFI